MGNINELCDDLLVNILSLIPTKEIVATSLLSRRWRSVWKLVPKLDLSDFSYRFHPTSTAPSEFIDKFLERNTAPVLETIHLSLSLSPSEYSRESLEKWANVAVARNVVDLKLQYCLGRDPIWFPTSLYAHRALVVLSLGGMIIEDVPSKTCFRRLKTLSLEDVKFSSDQTVDRFLSCCPVLETLVVRRLVSNNVKTYSICVPSLQSLDVVGGYQDPRYDHGYVIDAPYLKYLHIVDNFSGFCSLVNVPEKLEAEIHLRFCDSEKLLRSLTSARKLSLSLKPQMGSCLKGDFDQLVSLELCVMCSLDWLNVILKHSPKLRALRLSRMRHGCDHSHRTNWEPPSCIPKCLISGLETVEWFAYEGTKEEKNVVKYLLENGNLCFKRRWRIASFGKFSYETLILGPRSEASSATEIPPLCTLKRSEGHKSIRGKAIAFFSSQLNRVFNLTSLGKFFCLAGGRTH